MEPFFADTEIHQNWGITIVIAVGILQRFGNCDYKFSGMGSSQPKAECHLDMVSKASSH